MIGQGNCMAQAGVKIGIMWHLSSSEQMYKVFIHVMCDLISPYLHMTLSQEFYNRLERRNVQHHSH